MISIIVPIYNVEKYLLECLRSLANQSFSNFEVLLIDDGSTDNSGFIAKEFAHNNKKFKYFKKVNGGLSSARNYGITKAKGEWLVFVDSDDCVSPDYLKCLFACVSDTRTKIGCCNFIRFKGETPVNNLKRAIPTTLDKEMFYKQFYNSIFMVAWNKIYCKNIFSDIFYPVGYIHEDFGTTYKLIDKVEKISFINEDLYFYRVNENGISRSTIKMNKIDLLYICVEQIDYFRNKQNVAMFKSCSNYLVTCIGTLLSYNKKRYVDFRAFKLRVIQFYKEHYQMIKGLPLNFFNRIMVFCSFKSTGLLVCIAKLKKALKKTT